METASIRTAGAAEGRPQKPMLRVNDLVLETTRRCDMACEHCLRGEARKEDMSMEVMESVLSRIERAYCVTFTGGEPGLHPSGMKIALGLAKQYGI